MLEQSMIEMTIYLKIEGLTEGSEKFQRWSTIDIYQSSTITFNIISGFTFSVFDFIFSKIVLLIEHILYTVWMTTNWIIKRKSMSSLRDIVKAVQSLSQLLSNELKYQTISFLFIQDDFSDFFDTSFRKFVN